MSAATLGAVPAARSGPMPYRPVWLSPVVQWELCSLERRAQLRAAWADGEISHQLTPSQRDSYDKLRAWEEGRHFVERGREYVLDISRRWGKSVVGLIWLFENCIRRPGSRYLYIGPIRKEIEDLTMPLIAQILSECPPEMRPHYVHQDRAYEWPNGSRLEIYGLDKNPNASRGGAIDGAFLDECGFFKRLKYLVRSVLTPQMLGRVWACLLLASTPPDTPAHPWTDEFVPRAIARDGYDRKTIEDADQYTVEEIEAMIADWGGRESPNCRREFFAEHLADAERICLPEFILVQKEIVKERKRPRYFDAYTVLDPGWHDLLAALFGYWHFADACLVIEDEIAEQKMPSGKLAKLLKEKEAELWGDVRCYRPGGIDTAQPYARFSDRDPRLIGDLRADHGLRFRVAQKDTPVQAVNGFRNALTDKRVWIHPRCVKLQSHLRAAIWKNELHKQFSWQGGPFGHFDLLAAALYMWRNVNQQRNPVPKELYAIGAESFDSRALKRPTEPSKWKPDIRGFGR